METEIEKSIYKWVKKHDAIKLILIIGIVAICLAPLVPHLIDLFFFLSGVFALVFCNEYRKWNNYEDLYEYINRNKEIREIIGKYKSINNMPSQMKIRIDDLKSKNRKTITKIGNPNPLEHCDEWGIHSICKCCRSQNIWLQDKECYPDISSPISYTLYKKEIYSDVEFCGDCGYLEIN